MNRKRAELKLLNLDRVSFLALMDEAKAEYDLDPLLRQAAADEWQANRGARMLEGQNERCAARQLQDASFGCWGMGDEFWPVSEEKLTAFMVEHAPAGGMSQPASAHRAWLMDNLVTSIEDGQAATRHLSASGTVRNTCALKHPGMCIGKMGEFGLELHANVVVQGLHAIRLVWHRDKNITSVSCCFVVFQA